MQNPGHLLAELDDDDVFRSLARAAHRRCVAVSVTTRQAGGLDDRILTPLQRSVLHAARVLAHLRRASSRGVFGSDRPILTTGADALNMLGVTDLADAVVRIRDHRPSYPDDPPAMPPVRDPRIEAVLDGRAVIARAAAAAVRADVEEAARGLEVELHELLRPEPADAAPPASITLVGAPTPDLLRLPRLLSGPDLVVHGPDRVRDGDRVVFAVNGTTGPSDATVEAVLRCTGLEIAPVAAVIVESDLVADESLLCLIQVEHCELLDGVLPAGTTDTMLLLTDDDPLLATKILSAMPQVPLVRCGPAP